jgi:hypothetical protein
VKPGRWVSLASWLVVSAAGPWAAHVWASLNGGLALRTGIGAAVASSLLIVLPVLLPAGLGASAFERAVRSGRPPAPVAPSSLQRTERDVVLATGRAGSSDLHHTLCPLLRELASYRLGAGQGVDLDAQPDQARALLGDDLWDLVRADRPAPERRNAPGLPVKDLARAADRLESL